MAFGKVSYLCKCKYPVNGANVTIRPQGVGVDKGRIKVFGMWETYAPFF